MLNHLWQSTLFAGIAGLLTLALRNNRAQTRYWLWLAASVKFLIPFALLVAAGSQLSWRRAAPPIAQTSFAVAMEQVSQPFTAATLDIAPIDPPSKRTAHLGEMLVLAWAAGFIAIALRWWVRWRRVRVAVRDASPLVSTVGVESAGIEVRSSEALLEPGVFGVFRPVLVLPAGITERLTAAQLRAIVAHELCHVRRRDNLASAIHMLVEAVFWFHPLVWWVGTRLVDERERACDEAVLQSGSDAQTYAEGILKVCEFYLASPVECVAGVSGANLKQRIEDIMTHRIGRELNLRKKLMLAGAAASALIVPVFLGVVDARAQSPQSVAQAAQPAPILLKARQTHAAANPVQLAQAKPAPGPSRSQQPAKLPLAEKPLSFDAASIRVATGPIPRGGLCASGAGPDSLVSGAESRIASGGGILVALINEAYESSVDGFDFPDWVKGGDRFAISVTIPPNTTVGGCHAMIRNLLAERFHMVTGFETREVARLYIKVAKSGFKLKPADASKADPNAPITSTPVQGTIHYTYRSTPIARIIAGIQSLAIIDSRTTGLNDPAFRIAAGGGVVDETGLTGAYDGSFDVSTAPPADGSPSESFQESLTRQLGLTLELRRAPGKVLVIRSGDRTPTEN